MSEEREKLRYLLYRALGLLQMLERVKQRVRRVIRHPLLLPNIDTLRLMLDIEAGLGTDLGVRDFIYELFSDLLPLAQVQRQAQIEHILSDSDETRMN